MINSKGLDASFQLSLFEKDTASASNSKMTTFTDNMKLPIHRWFRYSAGFSAKWVENTIVNVLENRNINSDIDRNFIVLDPFVGSGTTLLAADQVGVNGVGFESHPLMTKVASSKLLWSVNIDSFLGFAQSVLQMAHKTSKDLDFYPAIIYKCYTVDNLVNIDKLKYALNQMENDSSEYMLSWLAFLSILRSTSHAGTAQCQYLLPNKSKAKVLNVFDAFNKQISQMCDDIKFFSYTATKKETKSIVVRHDARKFFKQLENKVDLVITSPPYANNYDYADATRLELCILGDINSWSDLQDTVRTSLIRSCTQHVSKEKKHTFEFLDEPLLYPIRDEIYSVCKELDQEKESHGGKKNYHTMIALYFFDLSLVWKNLRSMCKKDSNVCFVIGDSAPYGIYVPVDDWLGKLAISSGFSSYEFIKTRDRNIKWKNRKHNVPLKEGQLWVKG